MNVVLDFIDEHNLHRKEIVEPHAGSAIISLSLVANGVVKKASLVERDPLFTHFGKPFSITLMR